MIGRLLIIVLVVVSAVGVVVVAMLPGAPPEVAEAAAAPPPARVAVLVAARPVPGGTLLKPEDLGTREVELADLPDSALRDTVDARTGAIGAMLRRSLAQNEPIRAEALLRPGEHGFLAAVLGAGMRAVTVGVDAVSGTAGLIWPGDRVDLILTQALEERDQAMSRRVVGEQVLANVRVIAVDRSLVQGAQPGGFDVNNGGNRTVTMEVSPTEATRVAVASRLGRLSLSVRAAGTPALEAADARPVWAGDVSPALLRGAAVGAAPTGSTVRVFKGTENPQEVQFR
ncbi:Flp pilus assembly protein CpaB [Roseomonas sp. BN140053]|uniref:Flp pilus assembly protein CpaB n=1 Tax=Roseomonas sp. BN140053 TaxID=3391898 RepID=UPI0039EBD0C9